MDDVSLEYGYIYNQLSKPTVTIEQRLTEEQIDSLRARLEFVLSGFNVFFNAVSSTAYAGQAVGYAGNYPAGKLELSISELNLNGFSEDKTQERFDDVLIDVPGSESKVRRFDNEEYRLRLLELPNGKIYAFERYNKKTKERLFFLDSDASGIFRQSNGTFEIDLHRYGL